MPEELEIDIQELINHPVIKDKIGEAGDQLKNLQFELDG